jgi:hypothetical protein
VSARVDLFPASARAASALIRRPRPLGRLPSKPSTIPAVIPGPPQAEPGIQPLREKAWIPGSRWRAPRNDGVRHSADRFNRYAPSPLETDRKSPTPPALGIESEDAGIQRGLARYYRLYIQSIIMALCVKGWTGAIERATTPPAVAGPPPGARPRHLFSALWRSGLQAVSRNTGRSHRRG